MPLIAVASPAAYLSHWWFGHSFQSVGCPGEHRLRTVAQHPSYTFCHSSKPPLTPHVIKHFSKPCPRQRWLRPTFWTWKTSPTRRETSLKRSAVRSYYCSVETTKAESIAGVLGATGSVGQRFILLLALHPHFVLHAVGASERSAGKKYKDAVRWKQAIPFSERIGELVVKKCTPEEFADCDMVFSGLDSDVAGDVGRFRKNYRSSSMC